MPWILLLLLGVALASWVVTRIGRVSPTEARRLVAEGALVIDVRSEVEHAANPLQGSLNIPLDAIEARILAAVPDKDAPILLHCQSGGRSGIATRILRGMGYTRAFNLGSFHAARAVLAEKARPKPPDHSSA